MSLSSDLGFSDFLTSRNPERVLRERFNPPLRHVRDRLYDDVTDMLRTAMDGGTYLQLRLAVSAAFDVEELSVNWIARKAS